MRQAMPINPTIRCPCHGEPMYVRKDGRKWCNIRRRAASVRYQATPKGHAATMRWARSDKARERDRRYKSTPKGRRVIQSHAERRIWSDNRCVGVAKTRADVLALRQRLALLRSALSDRQRDERKAFLHGTPARIA